jgi:peroxiredoxin
MVLCSHQEVLVSSDCDLRERLVDQPVPSVDLHFLPGETKNLASFASQSPLVIYFFPGVECGADAPQVSDPKATEASDFRDHDLELAALGYRLLGIASQPLALLRTLAVREKISYFLASDRDLRVASALSLPTVQLASVRFYERLTLIATEGRIRKVFYPMDRRDRAARRILSWLYQTEREDDGC